jgi:hypothetical protein
MPIPMHEARARHTPTLTLILNMFIFAAPEGKAAML